jgi:hypothetical protein
VGDVQGRRRPELGAMGRTLRTTMHCEAAPRAASRCQTFRNGTQQQLFAGAKNGIQQ